jgi:hypothetical protein
MTPRDVRGLPCSSASEEARAACEQALWRMMSFYDLPLADLDRAIEADPSWAMPHIMKAGFLASLTEPGLLPEARAHWAQGEARAGTAHPRERAHVQAVQELLAGRWHAACRIWDDQLVLYPRDALALQWAHLWDLYRGDVAQLRGRAARALPEWEEGDPLRPLVMGLYAFGLEENQLYGAAEDLGRRALELDPRGPWAIHAVAHVMEMQGRFEEGSAWLRQQKGHWAEGNGFACHLWWHKALFRLEALDVAGVLRIVDAHLSGPAVPATLHRVDAAAMLWRLHLLQEDVSSAAAQLAQDWPADGNEAGHYAFNDVHRVLAWLAAGRVDAAEAWVARCAATAMQAEDAARANHALARDVGLPLMRGLLAFARGQFAKACGQIYAVRGSAQRLGGSHAQRDLIDLTVLAAAAAAGGLDHQALGRALLNERVAGKGFTPLARHWQERLGIHRSAA